MSKDYTFHSENGYCPYCIAFGRKWYIQDECIYGDKYKYALMSTPGKREEPKYFENDLALASFITSRDVQDEDTAAYIINYHTIKETFGLRLMEINGKRYVHHKFMYMLQKVMLPQQETGWFDSYLECLACAKEILRKKESEMCGEQMRLF